MEHEPEREIEVYWDEEAVNSSTLVKYLYNFRIKAIDRQGLLLDIIRILNEYKMELVTINNNFSKENGNMYTYLNVGIMIKSERILRDWRII